MGRPSAGRVPAFIGSDAGGLQCPRLVGSPGERDGPSSRRALPQGSDRRGVRALLGRRTAGWMWPGTGGLRQRLPFASRGGGRRAPSGHDASRSYDLSRRDGDRRKRRSDGRADSCRRRCGVRSRPAGRNAARQGALFRLPYDRHRRMLRRGGLGGFGPRAGSATDPVGIRPCRHTGSRPVAVPR